MTGKAMKVDDKYLEEYKDMVRQLAALFGRRYDMVDQRDIQQELWLWFITHKRKYTEWSALEQKDRDNLIAKSLRNAAIKYCEKEKASSIGYDITDVYYYSPSVIEAYLPTIITGSYELPAKIKDLGHTPNKGEVSDGMNWLVLRSDIAKAFGELTQAQQFILVTRFSDETAEWSDVGLALGTTADGARMKVKRAITALIKNLGGYRLYGEDKE